MELAAFKSSIKQRIPVDTLEVLRILDGHLKSDVSNYAELINLTAQHSEIHRSFNLGILGIDEKMKFLSRIWKALIELVDRIEDEDVSISKSFKLLVISKDEPDRQYMQQYFDALPITAHVISTTSYFPPCNYSLVCFDAHSIGMVRNQGEYDKLTEEQKTHLSLLMEYLEKAPKWLVYYGEQNYLINNFRETTNAANNKFSLYARIKEMMDFMENFKVERTKQ